MGGRRELIARGPEEREDSWQHFDTTKARSTLLQNKTQAAARGGAGREDGTDNRGGNQRLRRIDVCK